MKSILLVALMLVGCSSNDECIKNLRKDLDTCKQHNEVNVGEESRCINKRVYHLANDIWIESEINCLTKVDVADIEDEVAKAEAHEVLRGRTPNTENIRNELLAREASE